MENNDFRVFAAPASRKMFENVVLQQHSRNPDPGYAEESVWKSKGKHRFRNFQKFLVNFFIRLGPFRPTENF